MKKTLSKSTEQEIEYASMSDYIEDDTPMDPKLEAYFKEETRKAREFLRNHPIPLALLQSK